MYHYASRASSAVYVQAALGVGAEEAWALLRRLADEGLAAVEGQKRGTWYGRRK